MKKMISRWTAAAAVLLFVLLVAGACTTVPITGREQLSLVPESEVLQASAQQYTQFIDQHQVITNTPQARMVQEVGQGIAQAVETYFQQHNMSSKLQGYKWEFNLVKSNEANAFCLPGGKVVVYTGILPIARTADGLAVVMGHEIAHAVAGHGRERMSQQLLTQLGGVALSTALAQKPAQTQQLWTTAFGLGTQVGVLLPYSRLQESEADHLGLIFMSMAGYNPNGAVDFWQRMLAQKGSAGAPPEFLSTHPADQTRIAQIQKWLPEAMPIYQQNQGKGVHGPIPGING